MLKSYVSWQRYDSYYNSPWKGRLRDRNGNLVLDSIITNATAHYLHNTCFVLGEDMTSAQMPVSLSAELYNGKGIQTFDTAFLRGSFADGCQFYLAVTHSGDRNIDPVLRYEFENAVVTASGNDDSAEIIATFRDGTTKNYGRGTRRISCCREDPLDDCGHGRPGKGGRLHRADHSAAADRMQRHRRVRQVAPHCPRTECSA